MALLQSEEIHIRAGAFEGFRGMLFKRGIELSKLLDKVGIEEMSLKFPNTPIATDKFRRALNLAAELTNEPHFGLLMSQKQTLHKFGAIGYLMMHADTVGQSISCLEQYLRIHDAGSSAAIDIRNNTALWTVSLRVVGSESTVQHTELALGLAAKIIRIISSETWRPSAVYFERAKPKSTKVYEEIFKCPVYFEQAANALEFPEQLLRTKLPSADPVLYQIIQSHIEGIAKEKGEGFIGLVKQSIQESLENGKPCLEDTAQQFGMSASQLQRKLKQEGAVFQRAVQDVRHGLACKYLTDTDMPLATIAALLAYAEPAVFSRSFKRNCGVTPREWRREHTM